MSEWRYLSEYVETGSQTAFAALVERYIDLVYSTCLREVHDAALAEDVTQVVFLLLAKKAATLRTGTVLSGWLFQTARFASRNALKQELRRQQREHKAAEEMLSELETPGAATWEELEPLLHEALSSLNPTDRDAVLLRFFEGRSFKETAAALGISEDTAGKRVARAVEKLRRYFARHGFLVSAAILTILLASRAVQAAPTHCAVSVIRIAAGVQSGAGTGSSAAVETGGRALSIYRAVAKATLIGHLKAAGGLIAALTIAAVGFTRAASVVPPPFVASPVPTVTARQPLVGARRSRISPPVSPASSLRSIAQPTRPAHRPSGPTANHARPTYALSHTATSFISQHAAPVAHTAIRRVIVNSTHEFSRKHLWGRRVQLTAAAALIGAGVMRYKTHLVSAQPPERVVVTTAADPTKPIVTNTNDSGAGSLRQALSIAATKPGTTITFKIPKTDPGYENGVAVIEVTTPLPPLSADRTIIDGSSEMAAGANAKPGIALSGNLPAPRRSGPQGIGLAISASNCVVRDIVIQSFQVGIHISGKNAHANHVRGCYIGTDNAGSSGLATRNFDLRNAALTASTGNLFGIWIADGAHDNTIGGTTAVDRNVIAGNLEYQMQIVDRGSDNNLIQGNYIGVSADGEKAIPFGAGISIENGSANNTIGGVTAGTRNIIVGYGEEGFAVRIRRPGTDGNVVQGNYIGTDKDGSTLLGTGFFGVLVNKDAHNTLVGGTVPGARNVVAAQSDSAVCASFTDHTLIEGNYIGLNAAGNAALGAGKRGVCIYAGSSNCVGGTMAAARNVIAGNYKYTVLILAETPDQITAHNLIQGNYIGTDASGKAAVGSSLGNVVISGVFDNVIGLAPDGTGAGNRIAFSKGDGVRLYHLRDNPVAQRNTIRGNEIFGNGGLGINLQPAAEADSTVTPNDETDSDGDINALQNFPTITDVFQSDGQTSIAGILESVPDTKFIIDFYGNDTPNKSQYGEGQVYLGSVEATPDANGKASFKLTAVGKVAAPYLCATATNAATGDTSEFSACVKNNVK
jgi:RNA polymerase sigma factor (sigma-70 family)